MEMSSTSNQQSPNLGFHLLVENHRTQSNSPKMSAGTLRHHPDIGESDRHGSTGNGGLS